jgi:hypothetical protein
MALEITGKYKAQMQPKGYGSEGKTITKFYIDIDTDTNYPSIAEFQFFNDKVNLAGFKPGDVVTVHFNISGKKTEYAKDGVAKSGFFQNLIAWKIEVKQVTQQPAAKPAPAGGVDMGEDDLPF